MTQNPTRWRPAPSDIGFAAGLLTRLPIPVNAQAAMDRGAGAAWAYSLVGAGLGLVFWAILSASAWAGVPLMVGSLCAMAALTIITGAMHLDGFADVLDGFWGGWDVDRRLAIMKDSQLGVYGVVGLVLILGMQAVLWTDVGPQLWTIMAVFAFSRAMMLVPMVILPHARADGLSRSVGTPPKTAVIFAILIGAALLVPVSLTMGLVMAAVALLITALADKKINGQTGDVLGATQVSTETVGLVVLTMLT